MSDFVRICPRCGASSPEYANTCDNCGQFIAMVSPVPRPVAAAPESAEPPSVALTQRFAPPALTLTHAATGQVFTLEDGMILGQAHATSQAQQQLGSEIAGSEFVHRQHCRFEWRAGTWYVIPIDQKRLQHEFTNPTFLNGARLTPDEPRPLAAGDELRLAGVCLGVRIND